MTDYLYKILNSNSKIYIFISNIDFVFDCKISFMIKEITKKKKTVVDSTRKYNSYKILSPS